MSWAEGENGIVEMEENPDPEEDSDLPQRQHQNGEELGFRGEEDGPEEDLALPRDTVDTADTQSIPTGDADVQLDGDSFEQDEETAAPECENVVRHDAFSESDRQLFQFEEAILNQSGSDAAAVESGNYDLQASGLPDFENRSEDRDADSRLTDEAVISNTSSNENVESLCTVTGDVAIANNFDDAPEAEVGVMKRGGACPYEEEDNLSLFVDQKSSENLQLSLSQPSLSEQPEEAHAELAVRNVANIPRNESSELAVHEDVDHDLQAPECDREAVSNLHTSSGSEQQMQLACATELASSAQAPCDNNLGSLQLTTEYGAAVDKVLVSNESALPISELELRDDKENVGTASSSLADANDKHAFCVNEDILKIVEVTKLGQDEINIAQDSMVRDDFSAQSTDNVPRHHPNVPSSADHPSYVLLSTTVSEYDQPNSAQPPTQQAYSNNIISTQQSDHSLNLTDNKKIEDNLDSDSQPMPSQVDHHAVKGSFRSNLSRSSTSQDSATVTSQHSSPSKVWSQTVTIDSSHIERQLALALQHDDEDELLQELDAELLAYASKWKSTQKSDRDQMSGASDKENIGQNVNGLQSLFDFKQMQEHNRQLLEQLRIRDEEIEKLTRERDSVKESLSRAKSQVEEQQKSHSQYADDLYLPQIKTLENTVAQQQNEIKALKEKLVSHDSAAKRAVTTLQNELKSRVDQVTKMYEECLKEKDMMVVKFAESEAKNIEAKQVTDRIEAKLKEVMKDKDNMMNALKAAKSDKIKAVSNFEMKCAEVSNLQKEIEKLKEAVNSSEYRIKWSQNKLKDELESHKETKINLEKTTARLKEAREETEVIRKECHAIVKRYQESEEIKSKSLDKELKMKETELRTHRQERTDTEEIHQMAKRELDSLKSQHKDIGDEVKTYKYKVQCLEEERRQNHLMIENYQEIMQRQKAENADLKARVASLSTLEEDYKRAQEMLQTLDKDIAELKTTNRDLQKDMESCRERESKMLTLQSELSRTNAILRSENTNLSNKASVLTGEVEKLKMEVQELETTVKDLSDKYEEEKAKRKEEVEKMEATLVEKIKECSDLKQKWEDEIDNNKTLKRRHANNVKDLTRQLQQVRKKLDTLEGKGDAGSMGSRTNSNGSLNSIDNSSQLSVTVHQPPVQEFPVITEQVEVDKQVLIERIVRLQKSHARKNEKLEFLGEHIQQLLDEIRKKNKIIQSYALREESGTLSSEDMDANKTLLARKGGIMASVYSVHQQDGSMTLELSLQINRKLQAVLEDTLLKNITLKESLDTLGGEIARLSQENRRLQLNLQEVGHHMA